MQAASRPVKRMQTAYRRVRKRLLKCWLDECGLLEDGYADA
jgi:hypothetical protein